MRWLIYFQVDLLPGGGRSGLLSSPRSIVLSVIGLGGIGLMLWLMMLKPF